MQRKKQNKTRWQKIKDILNYDPWAGGQRRTFFDTLAVMLVAGIDLKVCLEELKNTAKTQYLRTLVSDFQTEVDNGTPLWRLVEYYHMVPKHYQELIRKGEQSGHLLQNLEIVVNEINRSQEFQDQMHSLSLYPTIVICLLAIVPFACLLFVLPRISVIYSGLQLAMPLVSRILVDLGNFIGTNFGLMLIIFVIFCVLVIYFLFFNRSSRKAFSQMIFKLPGLGNVLQEAEIVRFGTMLSGLLKSEVNLYDAFGLLQVSSQLKPYAKFYKYVAYYLDKGYALEHIFNSYHQINKLFPLLVKQAIISGERKHTLEYNLIKLTEVYRKKHELSLKNLNTVFEPAVMIVIWIIVTLFAVAMLMPIDSILQSGVSQQAPVIINQNSNLNSDLNTLTNKTK